REGGRVTGVVLERELLSCAAVVLALGPWSAEASDWIGVPIEVRPLKGQILRLQAPGPPVECSVGWGHNYATTKTDGLLWAGTTEEEAGFDEESTLARASFTVPRWGRRSPISSSVGPRGSRSTLSHPAASPALAKCRGAKTGGIEHGTTEREGGRRDRRASGIGEATVRRFVTEG